MELLNQDDEFPWATVLGHDLAKTLSANGVKSLGQVDIGGEQVEVLLLTFLLQLPGSEHHVDGPSLFSEATLTFRQESLVKVDREAIQQDSGKDLSCDR